MAIETDRTAVEGNDMVKLVSADDKIFKVEKAVALQSEYIAKAIEVMGTQHPIPLLNVSAKILEKVVEYCTYHVHHAPRPMETIDDIDPWDVEFLNVDRGFLSKIAKAAHYLDIRSLSRLVHRKIAEIIQSCKTPEKVRQMLNIKNDVPLEVEEEIKRSKQWAFAE